MRIRHRQHTAERQEQNEIAARAEQRHKRRQEQHRKQRDQERAHLTPGQRSDGVSARLSVVERPATSTIGSETPTSEPDQRPAFAVDVSRWAYAIAQRAVRELEQLEDELTVRDLRAVA